MKVFVYGTLRKGEKNAHHLSNVTCIHENAWVYGTLYDTGRGYPAMFFDDSAEVSTEVYGEIYEVNEDVLKTIDELEGYTYNGSDNLYERVTVSVYIDYAGIVDNVIAYVGGDDLQHIGEHIPLGDWKVHKYLQRPDYLYFAYGSCMDDERLKEANVSQYFMDFRKGILNGYCMQFSKDTSDGGKADIVECGDSLTEGIIYNVPMEAIDYLYKREGVYSKSYRPAVITVMNGQKECESLTFIGLDKQPETPPTERYANEIIRGGTGILSESYIEKIKEKVAMLKTKM
ncbi:MAG TPA: gamma-glutamylcyclotransferase [Bacillota bacterium]|nr:gamma-glutamylcyclotransferase [Bacillota bacterium]